MLTAIISPVHRDLLYTEAMEWFAKIRSVVLDAVYPPFCVACGAHGIWWCDACQTGTERVLRDPCPKCLCTDDAHHPFACTGDLPFSGVVVAGFYHNPSLRHVIHALKYQGVTATEQSVEAWLRDIRMTRNLAFPWQTETELYIQPMPLADARERDRGFNQAEWVADRMRCAWAPQACMAHTLSRLPSAMPQASIEDKALRRHNIRQDFIATERVTHPVILVDDVITTGSTAAEAARSLLRAGAPRVYAAALALGA